MNTPIRRQHRSGTGPVLAVISLALVTVVSAVSGLNAALPDLARETGASQTDLPGTAVATLAGEYLRPVVLLRVHRVSERPKTSSSGAAGPPTSGRARTASPAHPSKLVAYGVV